MVQLFIAIFVLAALILTEYFSRKFCSFLGDPGAWTEPPGPQKGCLGL